ncbi:hypothetical protein L0663_01560 [Dyadobacter sp. CY107]|uniref:hypothetical protein n=1 Tax=Dyadobacter fanqingshengii TaxID=2906443 RepID=UPI001F243BDA|nr:hypothetical protein [Dyadobacter fanqingshengii]MCF2502051.1 hypothetical protein [Dyadobacter fanqingshengii]
MITLNRTAMQSAAMIVPERSQQAKISPGFGAEKEKVKKELAQQPEIKNNQEAQKTEFRAQD